MLTEEEKKIARSLGVAEGTFAEWKAEARDTGDTGRLTVVLPPLREPRETLGKATPEPMRGPRHSLALGQAGGLPKEFRLFAAGVNRMRSRDVIFDASSQESVRARAEDWGVDLAICFDGDVYKPDVPGHQKGAAGFFTPAIRNGELWATDVRWTASGVEKLSRREFAFFRPEFHSRDGRVLELLAVSLTNIPIMKDAQPLVSLSAGRPQGPQGAAQRSAPPLASIALSLGVSVERARELYVLGEQPNEVWWSRVHRVRLPADI